MCEVQICIKCARSDCGTYILNAPSPTISIPNSNIVKDCLHVWPKAQCHTEYSAQCRDHVKLELEPYIETVCSTQYTEECEHRWEGEGNDKVWVPIPGTCRQEPHEACADVAKTKERQVTYPVCEDVPHQVSTITEHSP